MDRRVKKVNEFLRDQTLKAVPFDKGYGFGVTKETTYLDKQNEILSATQFEAFNGKCDDLTIKTEKLINSSLHQLKVSDKIYHTLRTTGSQPAGLYGIAKLHKNGTSLRRVLSIHGSSYENLNNFLLPVLGLLFNPKSKNQLKKAQKLLVKFRLSTRTYIVVRHDLIKNNI